MAKNRVKEYRIGKGLSQTDVAKLVSGSSSKVMISMIENGHVMPTADMMRKMCKIFDCKPTDLYSLGDLDIGMLAIDDGHDQIRIDCDEDRKKAIFEAIRLVGYASPKCWFDEMVRRLMNESVEVYSHHIIAIQYESKC